MRSFILFCAVALVCASIMTAPAPSAEAEVAVPPPTMDTLADIRAEAVRYYTDPSCTFVHVTLKNTHGDEHTVRVGLDNVPQQFGCSVEED